MPLIVPCFIFYSLSLKKRPARYVTAWSVLFSGILLYNAPFRFACGRVGYSRELNFLFLFLGTLGFLDLFFLEILCYRHFLIMDMGTH